MLIRLLPLFILSFLATQWTSAQVVTSEPEFPVPDDSVTVFFHSDRGNQELMDYSDDIWAHTGVITEESTSGSDWKYVVADWDENTDKAKLTRVETNLYKLEIKPTIREYYGVPDDEKIEQLAIVFRNSDGSLEGKTAGEGDIFLDVFQSQFNVKLILPEEDINFQDDPQTIQVKGIGAGPEENDPNIELTLSINDETVSQVDSDTLEYQYTPQQRGQHRITLTGTDGQNRDTVSKLLMVNPQVADQARPDTLEDGITYVNDTTVAFSLFAPYKDYVYLIGDFNNWEPTQTHFLKRDSLNPDSVWFWGTVSGLEAGKEYAFQYLVDGPLRVADPYSEKILDPFNDQYISEKTYPDLKPYPHDKTEMIAGVVQPGREDYNWQVEDFEPPAKEDLVIYELLIRDFVEDHDYETLIDTLDYLDRLGVNAIELMPVMEFDANLSWGYNPTYHMAVDKYYGPARDLKRFVDSAHARGMAVILDMVLNHVWGPSPLARLWNEGDYGTPLPENPYLNVEPRHDFNVGYDVNHESAATQYWVDRVNRHWLEEFHFDGFRFDLSKGFTQKNTLGDVSGWGQYDASRVELLTRMAGKIWETDPSAYVILEHFASNDEEKELSSRDMMLWGNLNHPYNEATMGYHESDKSDFSGISYKVRGWDNPHLVGYMESHDEQRMMFKNLQYGNASGDYDVTKLETALDRVEAAAALFFPVPGPKMVWQFGELGYDVSIDENGRTGEKPILWNEYLSNQDRRDLFNVFSELIRLRQNHEVFSTSDFSIAAGPPVKKLTLRHETMDVIAVANFDLESRSFKPGFTSEGSWYEYFTGDTLDVSGVNKEISLEAGEYRLYSSEKLEKVDEALGGEQHVFPFQNKMEVKVYPNPSHGNVRFEFMLKRAREVSLSVYNMAGQKVEQFTRRPYGPGQHTLHVNISRFQPGIYFYRLKAGNQTTSGRIIRK